MNYYPISLNLQQQRCLVIGGGPVAEGKVQGLLQAEALVTLIAPTLTRGLQALVTAQRVTYCAREYQPGDLADAFLVIGATDDRAIKEQVWQEAQDRHILVNIVDDTPHCTFIAPALLRRGDLTVAISTGGKAPALAVRLREEFERALGQEYVRFLQLAGELREPLAARHADFAQRKAIWYQLVDADILALLRQGNEAAARRRIAEITGITL